MNYQNIACWGDSQTSGARSYGCYPLHLAQILNAKTRYRWRVLNFSTNGDRARELWFRLARELPSLDDVHQACVLIGANDVGNHSPVELFEEYYKQVLDALTIAGIRVVHCGEIPPIGADGHSFFARDTAALRDDYNAALERAVKECSIARLVRFSDLDAKEHFCDPVHFNEEGNRRVAHDFARHIAEY
jgi:lysophospholipase L1-like esterase